MKTKKNELDVDFIGGIGPLTKEEEKRISDFIQRHKAKQRINPKKSPRRARTKKRVQEKSKSLSR
jgi:hypothetical protein